MRIRQENGRVTLETELLEMTLQPALGGKISSLKYKEHQIEFFFQDERGLNSTTDYEAHDMSGFDECFPTVAQCKYPIARWAGLDLGDHGWLWNKKWQMSIDKDQVSMEVFLEPWPIAFRRIISADGPNGFSLVYEITNELDEPVDFIYSSHPIIQLLPDSILELPREVTKVLIYRQNPHKVGTFGKWVNWPVVTADLDKWDLAGPYKPERGHALKVFTDQLSARWARLVHPSMGKAIRFNSTLPYLGIWLAQGIRLPGMGTRSLFGLALEPTTTPAGSVTDAVAWGKSTQLHPGKPYRFSIQVRIEDLTERMWT